MDPVWLAQQSFASLARVLLRLEERFAHQVEEREWQGYKQRLERHFSRLFGLLYQFYGHQYDFFYHLESILCTATRMWLARPDEVKAFDALCLIDPNGANPTARWGPCATWTCLPATLRVSVSAFPISPSSGSLTYT